MHKYVVSAKEKQATFTARQQRLGVFILPFLVAGLFGWSAAASTMSGTDASEFEAEKEMGTAADAAAPEERSMGTMPTVKQRRAESKRALLSTGRRTAQSGRTPRCMWP